MHRGADVASDHYLAIATIRLKLKKLASKSDYQNIEVARLNKKDTRDKFQIELKNRFSLLEERESETVEEEWKNIKDITMDVAREVIGIRRGTRKERWISETTWKAIDERRKLKGEKEQALSTNTDIETVTAKYQAKDKEVKKRCKGDKKAWIETRLGEAEEAAGKGDSKTLYKIVKELSGKVTQRVPIRDANGNSLRTHEEQTRRWKEHFSAVLNCQEPETIHDFSLDTPLQTMDANLREITEEEVKRSINRLRNGKSAGIDGIQAELMKSGGKEMITKITRLCNMIWNTGEVPQDWRDGIIIPIPKKGDTRDCNNWRGITLLSVPGKVMASIILNRVQEAADNMLRQQQGGFRKNRSCCDQIFALRQIIERCVAGNTRMLVNFIDFRKAFDSVHRPTVWNILKHYGIPGKIIEIIKNMYQESRCAVRSEGKLGDWFEIITGVRQGCVLSPLLFLLVMDWVMRRSTEEEIYGLEWKDEKRLADLDFADDIVLLDNSWSGMVELTKRVETEAGYAGLVLVRIAETRFAERYKTAV